jgi:hypothetical protein
MGFCKKCGRPRAGDNRFCAGCGTEFPAVQPIEETYVQPVEETHPTTVPVTAPPLAVEATRLEPIPAAAYPPPEPAADSWRTEDTVFAAPPQTAPPQTAPPQTTPSQAAGYPPPAPPGAAYRPASPAGPRRRSGGGRTTAFIVVGIVVALAAGGGAYALVSRSPGHAAAQPPSHPAVTVPASAAASIAPSSPSSSSPTASASASPSTSPSATATPSPSQTGTVRAAPGVAGNPVEPQVDAYLNRYFNSINTRNYSEYNSLLDAQKQQSDSRSSFDSGFATTKDSNEVLTGIEDTGGGSLTANVTFTSRQSPADSIDQNACNNWQLSVYLVLQSNGYVMTAAPAGYQASYTDC